MTRRFSIRERVEAGGVTAEAASVDDRDKSGALRVDFGEPEESPERLLWERFVEKFENSKLALQYRDETRNGATSRFFKFVGRGSADRSDRRD
jgi:hypothetical protein